LLPRVSYLNPWSFLPLLPLNLHKAYYRLLLIYSIYPIVGSLILLVTGKDSFYSKNKLKPVYNEIITEKIFSYCDEIRQDLVNGPVLRKERGKAKLVEVPN
jgi:hypothetical protein